MCLILCIGSVLFISTKINDKGHGRNKFESKLVNSKNLGAIQLLESVDKGIDHINEAIQMDGVYRLQVSFPRESWSLE